MQNPNFQGVQFMGDGSSEYLSYFMGTITEPFRTVSRQISDLVSILKGQLNSKRSRRIGKEIFWVGAGQAVAVLGSIVGIRLLTGVLSPEAYGELSLGMTASLLVNQVVLGPVGSAVLRFFAPADEAGELHSFLFIVRRWLLRTTMLMLLMGGVACMVLMLSSQSRWLLLSIAALFFAMFTGYNSVVDSIQSAARQRQIVAWHGALASWGRFLAAVGLIVWLGAYSAAAMLGYVLSSIVVLFSQIFFLKHKLLTDSCKTLCEARDHQRLNAQMFRYAWPFAAWGVFTWAQQASDRWALEFFATTQDVGLYSVLFQLGYYPMSIATGMAMQFLAPIFYERAGDASDVNRNESVRKLGWHLTRLALIATIVAFLLSFLLHNTIFKICAAREYASVSYLFPWMLLAGGIFSASQTIALNLMSQMRTYSMAIAKIVTAVLGVGFNFAGAYFYGIRGIVMAGVLFSIVYFLWMAVLTKRPDNNPAT